MSSRASRHGAILAVVVVALHLPFLPASLEDVDSINFALGVREFDVARHQPHPPGYPVFILAAKAANTMVSSEAHALSVIGILAGGLSVFALLALFGSLEAPRAPRPSALLAALVVVTSPLFWITTARPLSDAAGLAAALGVQAVALTAGTARALIAASTCAAMAAGIRTQVIWLTLPILVFAAVRQSAGRGSEDTRGSASIRGSENSRGSSTRQAQRWRVAAGVVAGYLAGLLVWIVPLILLSGGPGDYLRVVLNQGAEDFTGVQMLSTSPSVRLAAGALQNTFVAPWGFVPGAIGLLVFAATGFVLALRRARPALVVLAVAFGPYLLFHLLFQETATTRYALPLVVPAAYLAVRGALVMPARIGPAAIVGFSVVNVFVNTYALSWYSSVDAPAFRMLNDMQSSPQSSSAVLAMHRRHEFDLRRPILWTGDRMPAGERRLPSPPKHEWLELVKYWTLGGRQPVWFVADPLRSDLALVRRQRQPNRYRWVSNFPMVMGGTRPNEMDWHIIEPPDWYLGEGWSLTPETAGLALEDGRGPSRGGSQGWMRRWPGQVTMMIGGRNLAAEGPPARVTAMIDGRTVDEASVPSGPFLRMIRLPAGSLSGPGEFATVTVTADGHQLAIDQFDAQPERRVVFGYGEGWHASEYNSSDGRLWRWTSERAMLKVHAGGQALSLRMDGEMEAARSSQVVVRVGGRIVADERVGREFSLTVPIPAELVGEPDSEISVTTSAWYVPAERRRSTDRRRLGLKVYSLQLVPVS